MTLKILVAIVVDERRAAAESSKTIFVAKFLGVTVNPTLQTCAITTAAAKYFATRLWRCDFNVFVAMRLSYQD